MTDPTTPAGAQMPQAPDGLFHRARHHAQELMPGFVIVAVVVLAAQFVSEHYGAPAMLLALLFGLALNFVAEQPKPRAGIAFSSRSLLRIGVALLGLRISADMAMSVGPATLVLVALGMGVTIALGLALQRFAEGGWKGSYLAACSVAICGASAAMAIASVLPKDDKSEERLAFTVVGVTILSTIAMIVYPILAQQIGLSDLDAGIFLGATIHDVAQVVGAGFSISPESGETAVVVKLFRVSMLAPVMILTSLAMRRQNAGLAPTAERPPLVPAFVVAFFVFAGLNTLGFVPQQVASLAGDVSRIALLAAIASVGMKTNLRNVTEVGRGSIGLLVFLTLALGGVILAGVVIMGSQG